MTMVKTKAVTSARHAANVARYLDDERGVDRDWINVVDERRWADEMAATRTAYGHDRPSRAGAANTVMYHQVLAWLPDDCDMNGGRMGAGECMAYARQWCGIEYPNQEVAITLHREVAENDGTERWAAHLAVNRTDLVSGKRYDPGYGPRAAAHRAKLARSMDAEWGLTPTRRGRISEIHARQRPRAVKEMEARGAASWRIELEDAVRASVRVSADFDELCAALADVGIDVMLRGKAGISFKSQGHGRVRGERLASDLCRADIERALGANRYGRAVDRLSAAVVSFDEAECAFAEGVVVLDGEAAGWKKLLDDLAAARLRRKEAGLLGLIEARAALKAAESAVSDAGGEDALRKGVEAARDASKASLSLARDAARREVRQAASALGVIACDAGVDFDAAWRSAMGGVLDDEAARIARDSVSCAYVARMRSLADQRMRERSRTKEERLVRIGIDR